MSDQTHIQAVDSRIDELTQIIEIYNGVTERLQASHETLTAEVNRLQGQLASANEALQRSRRLAALGQMAAGIAHEVRNPLASIQLYADMLVEDLEQMPSQCDLAKRICSAVRGLDAIVGDVLAYARPIQPKACPLDTRDVFERAIQALAAPIGEADIRVVYHIEVSSMAADPDLIHQALLNLIRNGIEAMGHGGVLTLGAHPATSGVRLVVRDAGPGIGADDVDRIFNPFFTTRATGTGLGLAIVHRIVDAHGGSIVAANDPRGGAVFTLCLPDKSADQAVSEGDVDHVQDLDCG